jgi:hypothetical protein
MIRSLMGVRTWCNLQNLASVRLGMLEHKLACGSAMQLAVVLAHAKLASPDVLGSQSQRRGLLGPQGVFQIGIVEG